MDKKIAAVIELDQDEWLEFVLFKQKVRAKAFQIVNWNSTDFHFISNINFLDESEFMKVAGETIKQQQEEIFKLIKDKNYWMEQREKIANFNVELIIS